MKKLVLVTAIVLIILNLLMIDGATGLQTYKWVEVNPDTIAAYKTGVPWSIGQWIIIFSLISLVLLVIILVSIYRFKEK